jgi:putative spermidine/putrescine transport system substrate-binding protein
VTGSPSTLAIESLAYDSDVLQLQPEDVSWEELFNRSWKGRVALQNEPAAGFQQAALAAGELGIVAVRNPAQPSRKEIDALARVLLELRRTGQFREFWTTLDESVNLLAAREVVVEPLWPPALVLLQAGGFPVRRAAPRAGYRAWAGLLLVSREAARDPSRLQACYDYATWWLSGLPGALLMRQGYVNAAQQTSLQYGYVLQDEWDYWIGGEPAGRDLATPFGEGSIRTGDELDGGSLERRACDIAVWLSSFGEDAGHAAERWAAVVEG